MAVDEALLDSVQPGDDCIFRLYSWTPATLSLGYFQSYADREQHAASLACPCVRRASGGGAIVHDREWTYSLIVPARHPLARGAAELYALVHGTLIAALADCGAPAALCAQATPCTEGAAGQAPFLCFQRRGAGDVLLADHKIAGSAQRRRQGKLLQHGSILLQASPAAPELPGIDDLAAAPPPRDQLRHRWLTLLSTGLHLQLAESKMSAAETALAQEIRQARYDNVAWTHKTNRPAH